MAISAGVGPFKLAFDGLRLSERVPGFPAFFQSGNLGGFASPEAITRWKGVCAGSETRRSLDPTRRFFTASLQAGRDSGGGAVHSGSDR